MRKLIFDTLKLLNVPVSYLIYKGDAIKYITFQKYNQTPFVVADDVEKESKYYFQVSIWNKDDDDDFVTQVKAALVAVGFTVINQFDQHEDDTGFNHSAIRISIIKEV